MVIKKIKTILTCFCVVAMLSGCAEKSTIQYVDRPIEVKVPVVKMPAIKPIAKPVLPIERLTKKSSPKEIAEAYYNSLVLSIEYTKKLERTLGPFYQEYTNAGK